MTNHLDDDFCEELVDPLIVAACSTNEEENLEIVAQFLVHSSNKRAKLACLRCLLLSNCSDVTKDEAVVQVALTFCLEGEPAALDDNIYELLLLLYDDNALLLWELRMYCQHQLRCVRYARHETIRQVSDQAACVLRAGARTVESGLSVSTRFVTEQVLERTGGFLCHQLQAPHNNNNNNNNNNKHRDSTRSEVITRTYTGAAKRASESTRVTAQQAIAGIRNISKQGIGLVSKQLPSTDRMVQNEDGRVIVKAVGHVGMATVGAVTIVGEAVVESTKQVWKTTATVTANVVQHKFGPTAGQTVRDATDTAGNIVNTMTYVAMFKGTTITRIVAKDTFRSAD
jgi:hypothetical protein